VIPADFRQRRVHGLEHRGPVAHRRRGTELRQDQGQVRPQRTAPVEAVGPRPQVAAKRRDDRPIRRAAAVARAAPQSRRLRESRELLGETGLADARLATHEHQ
jgi:hypothetical protein